MNKFLYTLAIISISYIANAQLLPDRYNEAIFPNITETNEILFSTSVPTPLPGGGFYEWISGLPVNVHEYETSDQNLYMDIFEPANDTMAKRPLVIICFGGGFVTGSKDYWSIREIAIQLAKRGYVTATIDYRLGMNMFDQDLSKRAPYRGLQDGRSAIRFFKGDAASNNDYKIDVDNIYIGGHSAGAFIALHNAYLDKEIERPLSTYAWTQDGHSVPDQLCLDCVGDNQGFNGAATAVFSLAGALGDTLYIESSADPTVVMFHSSDDDTVPYDSGTPFGSITPLVVGDDLPTVYGSQSIAMRASEVGLDYTFNSYTDRGHAVHEETSSTLYNDVIPKISDSFFVQLLRPVPHPILGSTMVCNDNGNNSYHTIPDMAKYYDWQVTGGTIVDLDINSSHVIVAWDSLATERKLFLTPYSCTGARGLKDSILINVIELTTNTWTAGDGSWNMATDWSLGHTPEICEDIIYPDRDTIVDVFIPIDMQVFIHSLHIGKKVHFEQSMGVKLTLVGKLE